MRARPMWFALAFLFLALDAFMLFNGTPSVRAGVLALICAAVASVHSHLDRMERVARSLARDQRALANAQINAIDRQTDVVKGRWGRGAD